MQRHVKVDGKVRTDSTYPAGFMDVVQIEKTDEHFRLVYDAKGRFVTHRITKVTFLRLCYCDKAIQLCSSQKSVALAQADSTAFGASPVASILSTVKFSYMMSLCQILAV